MHAQHLCLLSWPSWQQQQETVSSKYGSYLKLLSKDWFKVLSCPPQITEECILQLSLINKSF
jgi:hypothetical protein